MQPMLKQILEWGSWTAEKESRAPFQSFLSAASTPSFQSLMASARDMVCRGKRRLRAGRRQGEGGELSPSWAAPGLHFPAWCSNGAQPPLRQLRSVAKAAGNVPTFQKLTHSPATREKERPERRVSGGGVWERKCIRHCPDGSVPQNASALLPSLSSRSSAPSCRSFFGSGLWPCSGQPGPVRAPPWVLVSTPLLNEGVGWEDSSFHSCRNALLTFL